MSKAQVFLGIGANAIAVLVGNVAHHTRGISVGYATIGNHGTLCYERTCSYDAVTSDLGTVEDDSTHANERVAANRASVNDGTVAYRYAVSHHNGITRCAMEHGTVLYISARTDDDRRYVAA